MKEEQYLELRGTIIAKFQAHMYKVKLQNGKEVLGQLNGKMRSRKVWCQIGDAVMCELSIYDTSKVRIFRRL
jgi:translation initiation factor IF-1